MTTKIPDWYKIWQGRKTLQSIAEATKSARCCSRKLQEIEELVSIADSNNIQESDWTTQIAHKVINVV